MSSESIFYMDHLLHEILILFYCRVIETQVEVCFWLQISCPPFFIVLFSGKLFNGLY